jgi:hypothetical protein
LADKGIHLNRHNDGTEDRGRPQTPGARWTLS